VCAGRQRPGRESTVCVGAAGGSGVSALRAALLAMHASGPQTRHDDRHKRHRHSRARAGVASTRQQDSPASRAHPLSTHGPRRLMGAPCRDAATRATCRTRTCSARMAKTLTPRVCRRRTSDGVPSAGCVLVAPEARASSAPALRCVVWCVRAHVWRVARDPAPFCRRSR
jgi:hypothetical protein